MSKRQFGFRIWGAYYGTGWTLLSDEVFHSEYAAEECCEAVTADVHSKSVLPSDKMCRPDGKVVDDPNPVYLPLTATMTIRSIKDSDGWQGLILQLVPVDADEEDFDGIHPNEKKREELSAKYFEHGEYAGIEFTIDENFKIISGRILVRPQRS